MSDLSNLQALRRVQTQALGGLSSKMLAAAFELEVFEKLERGSVTIDAAAEQWGLPVPSARLLAQFLCNMGLLTYDHGRLANTATASAWLDVNIELKKGTVYMARRNIPLDDLLDRLRNPPSQRWYQIRDGEKSAEADRGFYRVRV